MPERAVCVFFFFSLPPLFTTRDASSLRACLYHKRVVRSHFNKVCHDSILSVSDSAGIELHVTPQVETLKEFLHVAQRYRVSVKLAAPNKSFLFTDSLLKYILILYIRVPYV